LEQVISDPVSVRPGYGGSAAAYCPAGKQALGGGGSAFTGGLLVSSRPITAGEWAVQYSNPYTVPIEIRAYVVCAYVS
jgi:hypothetical protein